MDLETVKEKFPVGSVWVSFGGDNFRFYHTVTVLEYGTATVLCSNHHIVSKLEDGTYKDIMTNEVLENPVVKDVVTVVGDALITEFRKEENSDLAIYRTIIVFVAEDDHSNMLEIKNGIVTHITNNVQKET